MFVNMQADQATLQENSENTNQTIFSFSRDYDVSSNKTPSIKKRILWTNIEKTIFLEAGGPTGQHIN